jgi:tripartite-type tricarboxylate transporter receptor subunit TctC
MLSKKITLSALAISAAIAVGGGAKAQGVNFAGQTIELIAPYTEGGGADVYARMFIPFLQKHLPGNPTIIIRNLPGGASIMGNNRFEATAKPDGKTLNVTSSSTLVAQLLGGDKRKFDVLKWRQINVSPQGTVIYATAKTGVTGKDLVGDIQKLRGQKIRYGAKQPDAGELRNILGFDMLELKSETIFGLARGEVRQAMMRGELQLNHDTAESYNSSVKPLVAQGQFVPLWTLGFPKGEKIVRDPVFPDMPTINEAYVALNGKEPSGPAYEAYKAFVNLGVAASKGFALPKGTPDAIRDVYVTAIKKTLDDPEFRKLASDEVGDYPQLFGDEADFAIEQAVGLKPEVAAWLKAYLLQKFDLKM